MKKLCFLIAIAFAPAAGAAYKCVDERGLTHIGDTPPPGCAKVMMYEVTRSGKVLREIAPTMTEEQAKALAEAERLKKIADKAAAVQKRKDTALLATYASEAEFDVIRDRTMEPIQGRIKVAQSRLAEIDKRTKVIDEELEFYKAGKAKGSRKAGEPPPMLVAEQERLAEERAQLERNIKGYEREIVELRGRFDGDKQRWITLKAGGPASAQPKTVPASVRK